MAGGARAQHRPGRLPAELTNFVGRRHEVAQVRRLLAGCRLVTLTGVGGAGKTRLAVTVASEVKRGYADGVWLADLAGVASSSVVGYAVAETLDIREQGARDITEVIAAHLRGREVLLILDNCEHVLDGCARLVDVTLRAAPGLRVLCTSRQPLGTVGEHVLRVPPLPVPDAHRPLRAAARGRYTSLTLFAERAAAVAPGFVINADNQDRVAEICRRLDGLPLAIELAAAQLRTHSLDQLADRMLDRVPALSARYAVPAHHRTLEALFSWSYELCSPAERVLWRRMSVFADGFDLDAAGYVCGSGGSVLPDVAGLVDKSVLVRDESAGHSRYRLLETVRQYGLARLRAGDDDESALRSRHRDWYLGLAERMSTEWFGAWQRDWTARMRRERSNLRAALGFAVRRGDRRYALRLAAGLTPYWLTGGFRQEGRHWLERALAADPQPSPDRAAALAGLAEVLSAVGDPTAVPVAQQALGLARQLGLAPLAARATAVLGAGWLLGHADAARARPVLEEAVRLLDDSQPLALVMATATLGVAALYQGETGTAEKLVARAREICAAHGELWWRSLTFNCSALVSLAQGDPVRAIGQVREGLRLMRSIGDESGAGRTLYLLAAATAAIGHHDHAARLLGAAEAAWELAGGPSGSPDLRRMGAETTDRVRAALGEAAFTAAFAEGRRLSIEEALEYASGEAGDATDAPADVVPQAIVLTPREREVAALIAEGLSNKQIALRLVVAQRTAESHVENILRKLDFNARSQVAAWVAERGRQTAG